VEENTEGFEHTTRRTFAEQANLAVNQTFMRSINTSLISVLPILALMVIAVWLLGVGTLMDLALVQLVGVIVGTYSSIFFATPLLVTLRERTDVVRKHTRRVLNRRKTAAARSADAEPQSFGVEDADIGEADDAGYVEEPARATVTAPATPAASLPDKPAPGARPVRPTTSRTGRPSGKRSPGKR
jgi:preprotein translocase subunit SecF